MCLRRSGLHCPTKGASKEPRHLQLLAGLEESSVFSRTAQEAVGARTAQGFCVKPKEVRKETEELRLLRAEDSRGGRAG